MRAALYIRVSSDEQAGHGTSLITQRKACEAYARSQVMTVISLFEEDFSGRFLDRPALTKLRELIRSGELDALIVHAIDRYTREPAHIDLLLDELVEHNVELHTPHGHQDIESPEGRMYLGVQAQFGRFWWQKIREASQRARDHIKQSGGYYGNSAPYAFRVAGEKLNYRLELHDSEAEVIRLIYQYIDQGLGSQVIANRLTEQGYKPPRGNKWHPPAIIHLIRNPAYKGRYAYKYKVVRGKRITLPPEEWTYVDCPAIVSPELWERANAKLTMSARRFVRKHFFLLAGRLNCTCGYAMTAYPNPARKTGGHYGCNGRKVVKNGCRMPYLGINEVDNAFWEWIAELLIDPEAKLVALEKAQQAQAAQLEPLQQELVRLTSAMEKLKKRLAGYEEMCADGDISRATFKEHKAEIETQLAVLMHDYEVAEDKLNTVQVPLDMRERLLALFKELNLRPQILHDLALAEKRKLLEELNLYGTLTLEEGEPVLFVNWYSYEERCNFTRRRTA
jgi:site-specific DNA recombinase